MKNSVTIQDIANALHLSRNTVSKALNGKHVPIKTRNAVINTAIEMGYKGYKIVATVDVTQGHKRIILLSSRLLMNIKYYIYVLSGIEESFSTYDIDLIQFNLTNLDSFSKFKNYLSNNKVDGIICISGIEQIPVDVITRNIPIVCIDRKPKDHSNAYYVESNHYSGGYLATEELIKQGCKRIVIVSRNKTLSVNKQRLEGYRQALKDYHLKEYKELQLLLDPSKANYEGAREAMNQLIKKGIPFDGIFATNDWRAYGAMVALIENNIKIPEQVKIIGFDDVFISQSCHPSLSTIKQDISGLAKKASDLLLRLMNDIDIEDDHKRYILPVEVIRRDSTKKA